MKTRKLLSALAAFTGIAAAAACSSKTTNGDGATATPTPTPSLTFSFTGVNYTPHLGLYGFVRVLEGTSVLFCNSALIPTVGSTSNFTIAATGPILTPGHSYTIETFADLTVDNRIYDEANSDHNWSFAVGPVTTNLAFSFVHFSVPESAITWTLGTGCPGT